MIIGTTTVLLAVEESRTMSLIAALMTMTTLGIRNNCSHSCISEESSNNRRFKIFRIGVVEGSAKCATRGKRTKFEGVLSDARKVCHEPHSFEKCPVLLNIPFLKKHFIAYCLQINRTQKQMIASVYTVDATWGVHNDDVDV